MYIQYNWLHIKKENKKTLPLESPVKHLYLLKTCLSLCDRQQHKEEWWRSVSAAALVCGLPMFLYSPSSHHSGILGLIVILRCCSRFTLWQEITSAKWMQEEKRWEMMHDVILQSKCFTVNRIVNLAPSHADARTIMFTEIEQ